MSLNSRDEVNPLGTQVTALFRNRVCEAFGMKYGIPWLEIVEASHLFNELVESGDWVDTDRGVTFDKSFDFVDGKGVKIMDEFQLARDHAIARSNATWDAIELSQSIKKHWGLRIDWHVCSRALDNLRHCGVFKVVSHNRDGMNRYGQA